jgi:hypothetical protein
MLPGATNSFSIASATAQIRCRTQRNAAQLGDHVLAMLRNGRPGVQ